MTKEEFEAYIQSEEGKEVFKEHVEQAKAPLISKRDELLGQLVTMKQMVNQYKEVGDVEDIKRTVAEFNSVKQKLEQKDNTVKSEKEQREELEKHLKQQLEQERQKFSEFQNRYVSSSVDSLITSEISKNKGIPELLKPIVKQRVKAEMNENGDLDLTVLSRDGQPLFKDGEKATLSHLVEELKSDELYQRAFEAPKKSGTGSKQSNGVDGGPILDPNDPNYNLTEAMKVMSKRKGQST